MSSFRNAIKVQKVHRERHQPFSRRHLGPLEKKKDYFERSKDQNEKKSILKTLRKRALNKNPDEFHFHMINSEIKNGVHLEKVKGEELLVGDVAQDLTYITHRRSMERKKIAKLQSQLHLLECREAPSNSHIIFVDDEKQAKQADPSELLDTHPALLNRTFNRLRSSQLAKLPCGGDNVDSVQNVMHAKRKSYKELSRRIERENKLRILQDKLDVRKKLMNNKKRKGDQPKLVCAGTPENAPVYQWASERKKVLILKRNKVLYPILITQAKVLYLVQE